MELVVAKFLRLMNMRSIRMLHNMVVFKNDFSRENHLSIESRATNNYYRIASTSIRIYDDVSLFRGPGQLLFRAVNSNFQTIAQKLKELMNAYWSSNQSVTNKIAEELMKYVSSEKFEPSDIRTPDGLESFLKQFSSKTDQMMTWYNAMGCYSMSGLTGSRDYLEKIREARDLNAIFDNYEYEITKTFFDRFSEKGV